MFRTQNNVPQIYPDKSRDFQLLCRLKDVVFNSTKYAIDSIRHTANTLEMNNVLLPLLKSKVGFLSDDQLAENELRTLLNAFPYLVRLKGTKAAISEAIYTWFKINRMTGDLVSIEIDNTNHSILLNIDSLDADTQLLDELFRYLLPTAYTIEYRFATSLKASENIAFNDELIILKALMRDAGTVFDYIPDGLTSDSRSSESLDYGSITGNDDGSFTINSSDTINEAARITVDAVGLAQVVSNADIDIGISDNSYAFNPVAYGDNEGQVILNDSTSDEGE